MKSSCMNGMFMQVNIFLHCHSLHDGVTVMFCHNLSNTLSSKWTNDLNTKDVQMANTGNRVQHLRISEKSVSTLH